MIFAIYQCYRPMTSYIKGAAWAEKIDIFHPCTCTDKRLLTVDFKHPKVMRINQAYEVTDCNQLYTKNSNKSLRKALWCLAGSFTQPCIED